MVKLRFNIYFLVNLEVFMKNIIFTSQYQSPLGIITLAATKKGLCLLEFDNQKRIDNHFKHFNKIWGIELKKEKSSILQTTEIQLEEFFAKQRTDFNLPLDLVGSDFQKNVWKELMKVPYGTTRTYKEQAIAIGNLKAIRAVATANGENRISIIIPCHRIIGSDGNLTGYGGGIWRKQKLLELENNQIKLF